MSESGAVDLVVSFPAAGAGGTTLEQLSKLAAQRGMPYVALPNPDSIEAFVSGQWQASCVRELRRMVARTPVRRIVLCGHCMGGLSAVSLFGDVVTSLGLPTRLLIINTPCPDRSGRIPTMSRLSDAEIAEILAHDGFPQELLDDEDMLAEIAGGLRADATVADQVANSFSCAADLQALHVLSTRGDFFIPPQFCVGWWQRVSGEFRLTVAEGGHALDEATVGILNEVFDSVLASPQAERV